MVIWNGGVLYVDAGTCGRQAGGDGTLSRAGQLLLNTGVFFLFRRLGQQHAKESVDDVGLEICLSPATASALVGSA